MIDCGCNTIGNPASPLSRFSISGFAAPVKAWPRAADLPVVRPAFLGAAFFNVIAGSRRCPSNARCGSTQSVTARVCRRLTELLRFGLLSEKHAMRYQVFNHRCSKTPVLAAPWPSLARRTSRMAATWMGMGWSQLGYGRPAAAEQKILWRNC